MRRAAAFLIALSCVTASLLACSSFSGEPQKVAPDATADGSRMDQDGSVHPDTGVDPAVDGGEVEEPGDVWFDGFETTAVGADCKELVSYVGVSHTVVNEGHNSKRSCKLCGVGAIGAAEHAVSLSVSGPTEFRFTFWFKAAGPTTDATGQVIASINFNDADGGPGGADTKMNAPIENDWKLMTLVGSAGSSAAKVTAAFGGQMVDCYLVDDVRIRATN